MRRRVKKLFSSARGRFIACVAVSNLLAGLLSLFVWAPLSAHILPPEHPLAPWVPMLLAILLALPVSGFVSRLSARPLQQMLHATQAVARGDYTVRVDETAGGELGELLRSFNRMTAELSSTEMMRSDFISTFSHEFQDPHRLDPRLCAAAAPRRPAPGTAERIPRLHRGRIAAPVPPGQRHPAAVQIRSAEPGGGPGPL